MSYWSRLAPVAYPLLCRIGGPVVGRFQPRGSNGHFGVRWRRPMPVNSAGRAPSS